MVEPRATAAGGPAASADRPLVRALRRCQSAWRAPIPDRGQRPAAVARARLLCFANDVPGFYWDNFGAVSLTVERVHAADLVGGM